MKYSTIIFDMDGTLLNTLGDLADSVNVILDRFGYPQRTENEIRSFLGGGARNLLKCSLPQGTDDQKLQEVLAAYQPYYNAHCRIKTAPYDGIPELLKKLKDSGAALAVVSSKPDAAVQKLNDDFFPGIFDASIGDRPDIKRKPEPDAIYEVLKRLGKTKENAVYIGDSEYDVLAAKNAGIDGIAVSWGFRAKSALEEMHPDHLADNAAELEKILE